MLNEDWPPGYWASKVEILTVHIGDTATSYYEAIARLEKMINALLAQGEWDMQGGITVINNDLVQIMRHTYWQESKSEGE